MDFQTLTAYMEKEEELIAAEEAARKRLHAAVRAEKVAHKALVRARACIWRDNPCPKEEGRYAAALAETKAAANAAVAATRAVVDNRYAWMYPSLTK